MQKAEVILSLLSYKARNDEHFVFRRLYRYLYNPDFYRYVGTKMGGMHFTVDGYLETLHHIIQKLRNETYHPIRSNVLRDKKHFPRYSQDQWLQAVVREILESIYEPSFLDTSHGFRPNRSVHTALYTLKKTWKGAQWVIQGTIPNVFEQMDHHLLIQIIAKRVDDGRFLELIRRFLKAGCVHIPSPCSERIQRSGLGPLLVNIYLNELDQWIERVVNRYNHSQEIRIQYIRYAHQWMIFVHDSKTMAQRLLDQVCIFLETDLHLAYDKQQNTLKNPRKDNVQFLSHEIAMFTKPSQTGQNTPMPSVQLLVPSDVIRKKLKPFRKRGRPVHHHARVHLPLQDLIQIYHDEIKQLYCYYCLATDVNTKLRMFRFFHYHSLVKTIAHKEKSSAKKVMDKYGVTIQQKGGTGTRKLLGVPYRDRSGKRRMRTYFQEPLVMRNDPPNFCE